jgi:Arc/MetJ family transcription regulator
MTAMVGLSADPQAASSFVADCMLGGRWRLTALTSKRTREHTLHMKRTNLMLDEGLLREATRLCGGKTYSGTVNIALQDFVRRAKARRILDLAGSGDWEGKLAAMRDDAPRARKR